MSTLPDDLQPANLTDVREATRRVVVSEEDIQSVRTSQRKNPPARGSRPLPSQVITDVFVAAPNAAERPAASQASYHAHNNEVRAETRTDSQAESQQRMRDSDSYRAAASSDAPNASYPGNVFDTDAHSAPAGRVLTSPTASYSRARSKSVRGALFSWIAVGLVLGGVLSFSAWYWYHNYYLVPDEALEAEKPKEEKKGITVSIGTNPERKDHAPVERVRPTVNAPLPSPMDGGMLEGVSMSGLLRRLDEQKKASDFEGGDFGALMRATRKEATPSSTDWDRPAGEMKIDPASMVIQADSIPSDRREVRQALSPNEKLESGWPRDKYWKLLRNLLNRRDESKLDLEKAYLLISLYFNPDIEPDIYTAAFANMASELYERLTLLGDDGSRMLAGDPRSQLETITQFIQNGSGPFKGWDVQEYHPGITGSGTPLTDQNYLVHQVLSNGQHRRNSASNTALNILALILVRKLAYAERDDAGYLPVDVPLYGVRLPDRTILRYDVNRYGEIVPDRERSFERTPESVLPPELRKPSTGTRSELQGGGAYARNIEFLRNGNHYTGGDYLRRYNMSDADRANGVYLNTLSDKQMFATLGYELARLEIAKGTTDSYAIAQKILEEWVLDKDDGSGMDERGRDRSAPAHPMPRGDRRLRDAYVLYAQLLLQRSDYEGIKRLINESNVLSESPDRVEELRGLIAQVKGNLESASAMLESAIDINPENPRALLYLGDIAFLKDDGSTPPDLQDTDVDNLRKSIDLFNKAEEEDRGRLNGRERFLLHWHRALARRQRQELSQALADMNRVAEINPGFTDTPAYRNVLRDLRYMRVFQALTSSSEIDAGDVKFEAVSFLRTNVKLEESFEKELLHMAMLLEPGAIDNLAVQWELVGVLTRLTGQDFGRNSKAWSDWITEHFARNQ